MEEAIIACSIAIVGALVVAVTAAVFNKVEKLSNTNARVVIKVEKLSNTNARLYDSNDELLKACQRFVQHAERKNTITDRWDCKICGTLIGDNYHHAECPVTAARAAIAKAKES